MIKGNKCILFFIFSIFQILSLQAEDRKIDTLSAYRTVLKAQDFKRLSPTQQLLVNQEHKTSDWDNVSDKFYADNEKVVTDFVQKAAELELSMKEKGHVTFFHGRIWEWNFVNDVWNFIQAVKQHKSSISEVSNLRYRDTSTCDSNHLFKVRAKIMQHGVDSMSSGIDDNASEEQAEITFMTRTPISNTPGLGECPLDYCIGDASCSTPEKALAFARKLLKQHNLEHYQGEVENLQKIHKQASKQGELLCIAIDEKHVNEMVYLALEEGYKRTFKNVILAWYRNKDRFDNCYHFMVTLYQQLKRPSTTLEDVQYCEQLAQTNPHYKEGVSNHPVCSDYCFAAANIPGEEGTYQIHSIKHVDNLEAYKEYKQQWQNLLLRHLSK